MDAVFDIVALNLGRNQLYIAKEKTIIEISCIKAAKTGTQHLVASSSMESLVKKSFCNKFNYGVCSDDACEFDHVCIAHPDQPHRIIDCTEIQIQYNSDDLENDIKFTEKDK